jgi:hypothetical protein
MLSGKLAWRLAVERYVSGTTSLLSGGTATERRVASFIRQRSAPMTISPPVIWRSAFALAALSLLFACTDDESSLSNPSITTWWVDAAPKPCDAAPVPPDAAAPDAAVPDAGAAGCTRTQGYWKTHNEYATAPGLVLDWPAPYDEDDLLCGMTLLSILETPPRGDAWLILAHQYIAALLNIASGASSTPEVDAALASARAWLLAHCGGVPASQAGDALEWAYLLERYNSGAIGPGSCDEDDGED